MVPPPLCIDPAVSCPQNNLLRIYVRARWTDIQVAPHHRQSLRSQYPSSSSYKKQSYSDAAAKKKQKEFKIKHDKIRLGREGAALRRSAR